MNTRGIISFLLFMFVYGAAIGQHKFNYHKDHWGKVSVKYEVVKDGKRSLIDKIVPPCNTCDLIVTFYDLSFGYDKTFTKRKEKEPHLFKMDIPDQSSSRIDKANGLELQTVGHKELGVEQSGKSSASFEYVYTLKSDPNQDLNIDLYFNPIIVFTHRAANLNSFSIKKSILLEQDIESSQEALRLEDIEQAYAYLNQIEEISFDYIQKLNLFISEFPDANAKYLSEFKKKIAEIEKQLNQGKPTLTEKAFLDKIERQLNATLFSEAKKNIDLYKGFVAGEYYQSLQLFERVRYLEIIHLDKDVSVMERFVQDFPYSTYVPEIQSLIAESQKSRIGSRGGGGGTGNGDGNKVVKPADTDGDGIPDDVDLCPNLAGNSQIDSDNDGIGNDCDDDDDDDQVLDRKDNCVLQYNPDQLDSDNDGIGDACDTEDNTKISRFEFDEINRTINVYIHAGKKAHFRLKIVDRLDDNKVKTISLSNNLLNAFNIEEHHEFENLPAGSYDVLLIDANKGNRKVQKLKSPIVIESSTIPINYTKYFAILLIGALIYFAYQKYIKF